MRAIATSADVSDLFVTFQYAMQRISGFEKKPRLAVAVSGGADSLALALCAQQWVQQQGGSVTALVVDHGLRPEAATEAKHVEQWLSAGGISTQILTLNMNNQVSAIQQRARAARYSAMEQWCIHNEVLHLLLGHHGDDQAETFLFRLLRQSGFAGLAAMSMIRETANIRVLRPLLGASKNLCYDYLSQQNHPWIEDPSNQNQAFTRVGLRQFLALKNTNARLLNLTNACSCIRAKDETMLATLLAKQVTLYSEGFAQISGWLALPEGALEPILQRILVVVNGSNEALRDDDVKRLVQWLHSVTARRRTLHGCVVESHDSQTLTIYREQNALPEAAKLSDNAVLTWDRFELTFTDSHPKEGYDVAVLGEKGWHAVKSDVDLPDYLTRRIAQTLPAIWHLEAVVCIPHIGFCNTAWPWPVPKIAFVPAKPLAGAPFYAMNKGQ